jgi:hypothetical protein
MTAGQGFDGLYEAALDPDERAVLARAAAIEGLGEELALLRVLVGRLLAERPRPWRQLLEALALVVRAQALEIRRAAGGSETDPAAIGRVLASLDGLLGQGQDDE